MNNSLLTFFDLETIIFSLLFTLASLYAAYNNIVLKRISKYGFDAFILFLMRFVDKKQVEIVYRSPKYIRRSGVMMLLIGIGGVYALIDLLLDIFG